jgi:transposase-like protein
MSDSITTAFPKITVQTCIVHLVCNSLDYAGWKDRKALASALRKIYIASSTDAAINLLCLALRKPAKKDGRNAFEWEPALKEFAIHFEDRFEINHA